MPLVLAEPLTTQMSAEIRSRRLLLATTVLGAGALTVLLMLLLPVDDHGDQEQRPSVAPTAPKRAAPAASSPISTRAAPPPASAGTAGDTDALDAPNLFATFQLAIGSNDSAVLVAGLSAWRTCAGYVGLGTWDLNDWLDMSMPPGLSPAERERRAQHARADAARCAGFALQTDAQDQAAEMTRRALALGVTSEKLREAVRDHVQSNGESPETTKLSCDAVAEYPRDPGAIRLISAALRGAARARSSHVLNSVPHPAAGLAVSLAFCDLDPSGCDAHSNTLGSACVQQGVCRYVRVEDYLRDTTPPEIFATAQPLREMLVQLVLSKKCRELFD